MAFTYAGDPATSDTAEVRFLCGDTFDYDVLSLSDAEIAFLLTKHSSDTTAAAIEACERLANKCASEVNNTNINLSVSASERSKQFAAAADRLRKEGRTNAKFEADFYVGGMYTDDVDDLDEDEDIVQPFFERKGNDYDTTDDDEDTT